MVALKWLHRWFGLLFALPLFLVTLTGILLLFRPALEDWARPKVRAKKHDALALATVVKIAQTREPGGAIQFIRAPEGGEPWVVGIKNGQGQKRMEIAENSQVLRVYGPWQTFSGWLYLLHTGFIAGVPGVYIIATSGMALTLLALLGFLLWWPGKRFIGLKKRIFLWDWHVSIGVLSVLFLPLIGLSGAGLVFHDALSHMLQHLSGYKNPAFAHVRIDAKRFPFDEALRKAKEVMPGMQLTQVRFPQKTGEPLIFRFRAKHEWHPSGQNYVYFDGEGKILDYRYRHDKPLALQALDQFYPLHVAADSMVLKILYAIFSLALLWLVASGFLLWQKKR